MVTDRFASPSYDRSYPFCVQHTTLCFRADVIHTTPELLPISIV